jgi:hypothetical protein
MIPTILTLFAVAVILGLAAAAALAVLRRQNGRYARRFNLLLQNNGNMRSRYELQSNDPSGLMIFNFLANGSALGMPQGVRIAAAGGGKAPSLSSAEEQLQTANNRMMQTRFGVNRITQSIGGFFSEFGGLLPGSVGRTMRQIGQQITGVDMQMQRVQMQAGRVTRMVSIAGDAAETTGNLAGKVGVGTSQAQGQTQAVAVADDRAITPYIEPGAQLKVEMMVAPANPRNARSTSFSVLSRSTENSEADVVMQQGVIDYSNLSNTRYILSYVLIGAATLAALWVVLFALPAWGR